MKKSFPIFSCLVWLRGMMEGAAALAAEDGSAELEVPGEVGGGVLAVWATCA